MRYEFFAPYTEKYGHLADVATNPARRFHRDRGGAGWRSGASAADCPIRWSFRSALRLRRGLGLRWRVPKADGGARRLRNELHRRRSMRRFATTMAHAAALCQRADQPGSHCQRTAFFGIARGPQPIPASRLADGFPAPATIGNYALDPHYPLPYVEAWNLDVQKTLPWGIVMKSGYNGSKGNHLDITSAPRATASSPLTDPTNSDLRLRPGSGILEVHRGHGAREQAAHQGHRGGRELPVLALDRRRELSRGPARCCAQNWQNLNAEEGNSSLDSATR